MKSAISYFATKSVAVRNPLHGWLKNWEARAVLRASGDLSQTSILDLGAGDGYYAQRAIRAGAANILCLDANLGASTDARINFRRWDLNQGPVKDDFLARDLVYALGIFEFLKEPYEFLGQLARTLPPTSRLVILYPPPNLAGLIYRAYHRLNGLKIHLLNHREVARALTPLARVYACRPQPYARVEAFAHE